MFGASQCIVTTEVHFEGPLALAAFRPFGRDISIYPQKTVRIRNAEDAFVTHRNTCIPLHCRITGDHGPKIQGED